MNRTGYSQRLELRQTQTLVMTPQLQQAIKMLQLSNLELTQYIDAEIQQNPLLERREARLETAGAGKRRRSRRGPGAALAGERWQAISLPRRPSIGMPHAGSEGTARSISAASLIRGTAATGRVDGGDRPEIEQTATRPRTLREHLLEQIGTDLSDPGDRVIALHLLDLLDEAGYLRAGLDGVAQLLGCEIGRVEAVFARLQQFDPPGVFARDLPECLALQLRDRDRLDPAMQALLDNLPLLAARNIAALVRLCGVDAADMADMIAEIKSLDPRPGTGFRSAARPAGRARHLDASSARGRVDRRAQFRDPAPRPGQQQILRAKSGGRRAARPRRIT